MNPTTNIVYHCMSGVQAFLAWGLKEHIDTNQNTRYNVRHYIHVASFFNAHCYIVGSLGCASRLHVKAWALLRCGNKRNGTERNGIERTLYGSEWNGTKWSKTEQIGNERNGNYTNRNGTEHGD